jgi:sulfonate transport system substrate-binding protein
MGALKHVVVAAILVAVPSMAQADPVKIRLSYIVPVSNWATMLPEKADLAKHLNKSYTYEAVHFQGTPELVQAQAINELEIGDHGYSSFAYGILNAGLDYRIIADEIQDGVPGYYSNEYLVRNDSGIKTVEDLKGKTLAVNVKGSGIDIPLRNLLHLHHMSDKDVNFIEAPIPAMGAMLQEKKIDLGSVPLPFTSSPTLQAFTHPLALQRDGGGITELAIWVARASFIAKHRAALVDFLEDALRIERWYMDPANHAAAVAIAAKVGKVSPSQYQSWLFEKKGQDGDYYRDPNGIPNLDAVQANINLAHDLGFIKGTVDVKKYTDLSLIKEAAARLK